VKPGIYPGIANEAYHAAPGLSRSRLKVLLTGTPLDFHAAKYVEETPAMRLGTALELAVLEPDRFAALVRPVPKWDMRTTVGNHFRARWDAANPGAIAVPEEDYAQAVEAARILRSKKGPATALREGKAQLSLWWEQNGILCKSRPDFFDADRAISVDIKSTSRDLSDRQMVTILEDQFAAMQAAMVNCAAAALTGKPITSYLLVVKLTPPLDMRLLLVGLDWLEYGEAQFLRALAIYRECEAAGVYPGWADRGVSEVEMPSWLRSRAQAIIQQNTITP